MVTALSSTISHTSPTPSVPKPVSTPFHLRVAVHPHQPAAKSRFDGLWIGTYHTGAGLSDVAAYVGPPAALSPLAFINGTRLAVNASETGLLYHWVLARDQAYAMWGSVQANAPDAFDPQDWGFGVAAGGRLVYGGGGCKMCEDWMGWRGECSIVSCLRLRLRLRLRLLAPDSI
jgi:hypothetical protein